MFQVSLYGPPDPMTADEKKAAKKGKDGKTRDRLKRLSRVNVETDSAVDAAKFVANALSKLTPAKQGDVIAIDLRRVAKPDPNAPLF